MSTSKVSLLHMSTARSRMHSRSCTIQFAPRHLFALLLSAFALCAQAQTASPVSSDNTLYAEIAKAPAKATARPNPMEHDRDALLAGQKLYDRHCAECHGETGEGGKGSKKDRAYSPLRCSRRPPEHSSGSSQTESSAAACPYGPNFPNHSAGN